MMVDRAERLRRKIAALEFLEEHRPGGCSSCRQKRLRKLRSRLAAELKKAAL